MHLHLFCVSFLISKSIAYSHSNLQTPPPHPKSFFFVPFIHFLRLYIFVFIFFYQKTEKLLPKHIITFRVNVKINRTTSVENETNSNKKIDKWRRGNKNTKKLFHSSRPKHSLFVHVVLDIDHKLNFILL